MKNINLEKRISDGKPSFLKRIGSRLAPYALAFSMAGGISCSGDDNFSNQLSESRADAGQVYQTDGPIARESESESEAEAEAEAECQINEGSWSSIADASEACGIRHGQSSLWTGEWLIVMGGNGRIGEDSIDALNSGCAYNPQDDLWVPLPDAPLDGRLGHCAVWKPANGDKDAEMIIWGGVNNRDSPPRYFNDGARLTFGDDGHPTRSAWTALPVTGAPDARAYHHCSFDGDSDLIVGGGSNPETLLTWARFHLYAGEDGNGSWSGINSMPEAIHNAVGFSTGDKVGLWGWVRGGPTHYIAKGFSYNDSDGWQPISSEGAPEARNLAAYAWNGSELAIWGGVTPSSDGPYLITGAVYNAGEDTWTPMATKGAPSPRRESQATWVGNHPCLNNGGGIFIFGGADEDSLLDTGAIYEPARNKWTEISDKGNPSSRSGRFCQERVGQGEVVVGFGNDGISPLNTCAKYQVRHDDVK